MNKKMDSNTAYKLLTEGIIYDKKDLREDKNRWILHCLYSGVAAGRIAGCLGLDSDYATALGYIHDIGRRVSHPKHIIEGYHYIKKIGYNNEARICLTHSFINNDITLAAGPFPGIAFYKSIIKHLNTEEYSGYDNIIQLCDLFCLETGFTTLEKRILDISTRKGVFPSSRRHFEKALELKDKIEKAMGSTLYSLFPEIPIQDLEDNQKYLNKLEELFTNINFRPLSIGLSTDITLSEEDKSYYVDKLLRDEHEVFFISDEELSNNIKEISSKVDIMYTNNERHSNDLEALGVPCIVENNKSDNLKVSTWEELYQQVSAKSSNEIYPITDLDKNNHKGLIKK